MISGSGTNEYTTISRELLAATLNALDSDDRAVREDAYDRLLAVAPPGWGVDLDDEATINAELMDAEETGR